MSLGKHRLVREQRELLVPSPGIWNSLQPWSKQTKHKTTRTQRER